MNTTISKKIYPTKKKFNNLLINLFKSLKTPSINGVGNERYMFIGHRIPTICGFGVSGDNAYSMDEYMETDSIEKIIEIYTKTILSI